MEETKMKTEIEIIIVEDNPNDAELMVRTLKKNQLVNNLIVLEDGEKALDFIFGKDGAAENNLNLVVVPKVIFLDLKLPKIHGLEVLKQLKSNKLTKEIPVIIVTSSKEDPDIETAYKLGANSYVVKPVKFDDFVETINKLGIYWLLVNEKPK